MSDEEEEGSDSDCGTYPQLYAGKEKRRRLAERDRRRSLPVKPHVWPAVPLAAAAAAAAAPPRLHRASRLDVDRLALQPATLQPVLQSATLQPVLQPALQPAPTSRCACCGSLEEHLQRKLDEADHPLQVGVRGGPRARARVRIRRRVRV